MQFGSGVTSPGEGRHSFGLLICRKTLGKDENAVPVIRTQDRAHDFRIIIEGRLAGESVPQVASIWSNALSQSLFRTLTVDISLLTGYDNAGRKLLRDMHLHGTSFAASTPQSLVFLAEITAPRHRGFAVIPEPVIERGRPTQEGKPQKPLQFRAANGK